jgi:hypothetical protein
MKTTKQTTSLALALLAIPVVIFADCTAYITQSIVEPHCSIGDSGCQAIGGPKFCQQGYYDTTFCNAFCSNGLNDTGVNCGATINNPFVDVDKYVINGTPVEDGDNCTCTDWETYGDPEVVVHYYAWVDSTGCSRFE